MNKRAVLAVWLALLTLTSVVDIAAGASRLDTTALTSAGRYIVALADERANPAGATAAAGVSGRSMAAEAAEVDGRVGRITSDLGVRPSLVFRYSVHGFAATLTQGQLRALARDRRVARIQLDQRVRVDRPVERLKDARSPTDSKSSTSDLASVNVVTLGSPVTPTGVRRVGADRSAEARINGIDERVDADVAIIDTGIDRTHPDLNVVGGYNCTTSDRADLHDGYGHGTHVAGTVGALDNGRGVVGVAPGARLWAVKVFDDAGDGWISWFVCGIDWVTAHRDPRDAGRPLIEAANMSLRSPLAPYTDAACGYPSGDIEHQAICRSIAAGTTYAVAAGNDSTYASFWRPAAYNEPITVSALADFDGKPGGVGSQADTCPWYAADEDDTFANFSNYGADVDVMAPGKCILSTYPGGRYAWMSGTSMATPTVAGAVALYKVRYPTARPQQIKQALVYAANLGWKTSTDPDGRPDRLLDVSSFAPPPVFSLAVGQPTRYLGASLSLSLPVRVGRANGHTAPVTLTLSGLPAGVTAATNPPAITGTTATLVLKGSSAMPNGRYPLTVRASDAELTASTSITLMTDAKAPVGRFTAPTPGSSRLQSSTVVAVAWSESESGGSGLVSRSLQRQRGAVVRPGSCMGFAYLNDGAASNRASPTSVSGLAGGFCYRWVERLTDGAGNTTSAVSGSVLVDTSAPGMPNVTAAGTNAAQVGTNGIVYFNSRLSGRMTLSASGSDPQSGMATTTFGRPSPATGWSGGGTTVTGEPASAALSWSVGATSTSVAVKSTNRVGLAGPARAMSLRSDVTGPTAATWRSPVGTSQQASTTRVLSWTTGTDSGSGVASRQLLQRQRGRIMTPGTCSGVSFGTDGSERIVSNGSSDSGLIGGYCYRWLLTAVDRVGNRGAAVASGAVLVDRVAPTSDFATPGEALTTFRASTTYRVAWTARDTGGSVLAGRSLQRQRGPIVRSGSCAGVRWANDGPRTTAASPVSASGLLGGSCYRWTLRQTDAAGNYRTHYSGAVLVDTSAPPAATITARGSNAYQAAANRPIYFRSSIARSLSVTSLGSDPQSGAASASVGKVTASGWSNGSANVGNPSTRTLSWSAGASNATISGTSRNRAGLLGPWRSVSLVGDRTAPVVRFTTPSSPVYAATTSIALAWTVTDSGSGVGTTGSLQRQRVASTKASCPTTGWAYDGAATRTTSGSTVGGLVPGFCYRWTLTFPDRVGNAARVTSTTVRVDGTPPVTSIRGLWPLAGVRLTSVRSVPIGFSWAATDDTGVVAGYEVRMRAGSGAWALLRLASATSTGLTTTVNPTLGYRFAIRARDRAGNWSGWIEAPVHFSYTQSTYSSVTYAGTWTSSSLLGATDGRVHWTMTAGARAKLTFRGRSVAWISTLGPDRGQADVYLDGVRIRTVDLRAASMVTRQSVFGAGWRTNGTHTVEIRSRGTSGRPRIDLDAFLVVGP